MSYCEQVMVGKWTMVYFRGRARHMHRLKAQGTMAYSM